MNMSRLRPLLGPLGATVLVLASAQVSAEQIYRWVDENGVVNYTQQKPRDTDAEAIFTRSGRPQVVAEAQPAGVETAEALTPEQEKMLEGLRAAEQARQHEIAKIRDQNCQQSRDVLARLQLKNRLRVRGEDGEYRIMPEDERQERIATAQENVTRYCSPA